MIKMKCIRKWQFPRKELKEQGILGKIEINCHIASFPQSRQGAMLCSVLGEAVRERCVCLNYQTKITHAVPDTTVDTFLLGSVLSTLREFVRVGKGFSGTCGHSDEATKQSPYIRTLQNLAADQPVKKFTALYIIRPPLWSSGQSFWLQIQRSRVRFPALPDFLSSSGSGTGSTQPREVNWGATWI